MKVDALTSLPALGALWPEQGGHFAGITRDAAGATFAVIVASKEVGDALPTAQWGGYGKSEPGAIHWTDGLANTGAKSCGKLDHPAADVCTGFTHEGHADWYLPSIGELQLAYMHCKDQFSTDGYYWSSTQYGRYSAWVQAFVHGYSLTHDKGLERRVRPFRRFILLCRPGASLCRLPAHEAQQRKRAGFRTAPGAGAFRPP